MNAEWISVVTVEMERNMLEARVTGCRIPGRKIHTYCIVYVITINSF